MQIVIAWVDMTGLEATGRYLDRYQLEREVRAVAKARACMWLNDGTEQDVVKAKAYAAPRGHAVYVFTGLEDPIARAKELALAAHKEKA